MNNYILETKNITKKFKNVTALNNVSIALEKGKIYGFIGQNGAGKTTLMRIIAGLCTPTSGHISLFSKTSVKDLETQRKKLGCMIENPSLYPDMTAKDNLKLYRTIKGIPNEELDTELLKLVGLNCDKKKVKNFSLGMKQKLGIAISLIGNPELLILDEPTNGIDPIGILEIRNLLTRLCEEKNITILISSHILSELYKLASNYIIINKGEIKAELTLDELHEKCRKYILLNSNEPERMVYILENILNTTNYKVMNDKSIKLYDFIDKKDYVAKVFFDNKLLVTNLSSGGDNLEDYFVQVIGGAHSNV